jgi:hypothetical protein
MILGKDHRGGMAISHQSESMGVKTAIGFLLSTFLVAVGLLLVYVAGNIVFSSSEGAIFQWWIAVPGIGLAVVGAVLFLLVLRRHNLEVRKGG